ncbi:magnesium transporter CorA family protein [Labrys wisconsinensis]|uniref:Magnesium transporter n=1 Tax=Labrys wisconsinensis TaxID=425677 RepID=A0ABU0J8S7_9HYPH|nr:magnesium transporter CorA family protein [Labrys wisconsinensis]MDQ0470682.1 magnesium transporter [Labrys wisconsinensis]
MLSAYGAEGGALTPIGNDAAAVRRAVWIDLVSPTREEEKLVEASIGVEVPTREEMREIEPSSRLYVENGSRFLTAVLVMKTDTGVPSVTAVTFILHGDALVTVRYDDPKPFALYCARAAKPDSTGATGEAVLGGLLDTIVDRLADILEKVGDDLDALSRSVFAPDSDDHARFYKEDMRALGRRADLISKARESLVSLARLLLFLTADIEGAAPVRTLQADVRTMRRDVESLALHADYLTSKAQLLLDAVVGMVSIEQNNIIKIFAVLSVVLMPPTLVASIYGMNFKVMPELDWSWGYPAALAVMAFAGALPYLYFKWKRWL